MIQVDAGSASVGTRAPSARTTTIEPAVPFDALLSALNLKQGVDNDNIDRARRLRDSYQRHDTVSQTLFADDHAPPSHERVNTGGEETASRADQLNESQQQSPGTSPASTGHSATQNSNDASQPSAAQLSNGQSQHTSGTGQQPRTLSTQVQAEATGARQAGHSAGTPTTVTAAATSGAAHPEAARVSVAPAGNGVSTGQVSVQSANVAQQVNSGSAQGGTSSGGGATTTLTTAAKAPAGAPQAGATSDFQSILRATEGSKGTNAAKSTAVVPQGAGGETVRIKDPESVQELARVVRSNLGSRHASMTLRLDPPELGTVRIDVRMNNQALTLHIEAQTEAGRDALQSRLSDLKQALEQHGVRVERAEVELRPPTPTSHGQDAAQQEPQQNSADRQGGESARREAFTEFNHSSAQHGSASSADESSEFVESRDTQGEGELIGSAESGLNVVV